MSTVFHFLQLQSEFVCGGSPRKFTILTAHNEARRWISDGLGGHIVEFSRPIIVLYGKIKSKDHLNILGDHVHPMVQALFSDGDGIYQDNNNPMHTAHVVKNWYEKNESELEHM